MIIELCMDFGWQVLNKKLECGCPNGTKYLPPATNSNSPSYAPENILPNRALLPNRAHIYKQTDRWTGRFQYKYLPQLPPFLVIFTRWRLLAEHAPSPLVYKVAERQKRNLLQSHLHQEIYLCLCKNYVKHNGYSYHYIYCVVKNTFAYK